MLQVITTAVSGIVLGRDENGLYAMSADCTHQGFGLSASASGGTPSSGLFCGRHGAGFDLNGVVIRGPATRDLPHYPLEIMPDGSIKVCVDSTVPPETRTRPP